MSGFLPIDLCRLIPHSIFHNPLNPEWLVSHTFPHDFYIFLNGKHDCLVFQRYFEILLFRRWNYISLMNCVLTTSFFLQFKCQRRICRTFFRSVQGVFTTLTIEAGRTAVVNDRTFAIIAFTFNRVK